MHLQYLHIASRLVWQNVVSSASEIIAKNFVIKDMIYIFDKKKVLLKGHNTFSIKFPQSKLDSITRQMANVHEEVQKSKAPVKAHSRARDKISKLTRVSKQMASFGEVPFS